MTKPANFPGRKLARQKAALDRFPAGPSRKGIRSPEAQAAERTVLVVRAAVPMQQAIATRTKRRSGVER